jgi:hypothetical protein
VGIAKAKFVKPAPPLTFYFSPEISNAKIHRSIQMGAGTGIHSGGLVNNAFSNSTQTIYGLKSSYTGSTTDTRTAIYGLKSHVNNEVIY